MMDWLTGYVEALTLAGLRMVLAALGGVTLFLPRFWEELRAVTRKELAVLFGAALFGLLIGQYFFVYSVNLVGSEVAAPPVSAINPIISSALAIVLLKESPPNKRILEGLVLAVLGVILISTA